MTINNNLKQLRTAAGLTQEQVAEKLNLTRQALSSYESGRTRPDIDTLVRLAEIYGTDINSIIYGTDYSCGMARMKKAIFAFSFMLVITSAVSEAISLCSNIFFPVEADAPDFMSVMDKHFMLAKIHGIVDSFLLTVSFVGFIIILTIIAKRRFRIDLKVKAKYILQVSVALLLPAIVMGITDPVFHIIDYVITPLAVIGQMLILFIPGIIIELIQRKLDRPSG